MSDEVKYLDTARDAVALACVVCRSVQDRLDEVRAILKNDKSPVTVADYASQAVIAHAIYEHTGSCIMVGEEDASELRDQIDSGETAAAEQMLAAVHTVWPEASMEDALDAIDMGNADAKKHHNGFWTLDPIDGTKGFLRNQQYAIALAWIEHGSPVLAAMGCPNLSLDQSFPLAERDAHGSLYVASAGNGVYEYRADQPDESPNHIRRLSREQGEPVRMCESAETGHTSHDDAERILELIGEAAEPARLDSQAKYAVVARGQADLYLRLPRPGKPYVEKIWDHAAGSLVAREAGCAVTDIRGHELDFGHGSRLEENTGIVVGDVLTHGHAIEAIEKLGIGRENE